MFSLFVWMELCMNTSKIRVFYARLEISAFLQPLEQLLGVGFLDLTKQSASGEKLSENLSAGQNLNRPPLLPLKKQNRESVRLKFYRWPLGRRKKSDWLFITERKVQVKTTPGTKFPDPGLSFPFSFQSEATTRLVEFDLRFEIYIFEWRCSIRYKIYIKNL